MKIPRQYVDTELFYQCGSCNHYHAIGFDGDCREDSKRFTAGELDEMYGSDEWQEVEQPQ